MAQDGNGSEFTFWRGKRGVEPNIPGRRPQEFIEFETGEPGVKLGQ
jgi:hypothetical protein